MSDANVRSFYRVAKRFPPDDEFYLTHQDKYGDPPEGALEETRRAWDALSFYNSEAGARRCGEENTHLGGRIVRFRIPEGVGLTWDPPDDDGHQNVRGDREKLKLYLDVDYVARVHVRRASHQGAMEQP